MRIVCLADTHSLHDNVSVPDGDVLICAGDFSNSGDRADLLRFNVWLGSLPHARKYICAGNHDWNAFLERETAVSILTNGIYVQDEAVTIDGYKFYFSPFTQEFCGWAFMLPEDKLKEKWDQIPEDTDVLVTHGPPYGILDRNREGGNCGCRHLLAAVKKLKPKYHLFGHIHEGYGMVKKAGTKFINASVCTRQYRPTNKPVVINLRKLKG